MKKLFLIGMLAISSLTVTAKTDHPVFTVNHQADNIVSRLGIISPDDISDKLAADIRFKELINLGVSFANKVRSMSTEDKKLYLTFLNEKNGSKILELFTKCGIDFKNYMSTRASLLKALDKDYALDKRSDTKEIIRAAIVKLDPPTFAECLALWSNGSSACYIIFQYDEQGYNACMGLMMAEYLLCLSWLP